jgi:hypothetical protein
MFQSRRVTYLYFAGLALLAAGSIPFSFIDAGEGGPIEVLQEIVLLAAAAVWAMVAVRLAAKPPATRLFHPVFAAMLAGAGAFAGLREVSWFRVYGLTRETSHVVMWIALALIILAIALTFYRTRSSFGRPLEELLGFLRRSTGFLLLTAGLVTLGDAFEKQVFPVEAYYYYEEVFELLGYLNYLVFAAYSFAGTSRRRPTVAERRQA